MANLVTGIVRLSYTHLLTPYTNNDGVSKYSTTILLPKSDTVTKAKIDNAIAEAISQGKSTKWNGLVPPIVPTPIHDGDGVRTDGSPFPEECKGHWVFTASTTAGEGRRRPEIVGPDLEPIIDANKIYSGMYARVSVNFAPYFAAGKKGVGCYLGNVQKVKDGEPLGSSVASAKDEFAQFKESQDAFMQATDANLPF